MKPSEMPKGVEHTFFASRKVSLLLVKPSEMPKGVEHLYVRKAKGSSQR